MVTWPVRACKYSLTLSHNSSPTASGEVSLEPLACHRSIRLEPHKHLVGGALDDGWLWQVATTVHEEERRVSTVTIIQSYMVIAAVTVGFNIEILGI